MAAIGQINICIKQLLENTLHSTARKVSNIKQQLYSGLYRQLTTKFRNV